MVTTTFLGLKATVYCHLYLLLLTRERKGLASPALFIPAIVKFRTLWCFLLSLLANKGKPWQSFSEADLQGRELSAALPHLFLLPTPEQFLILQELALRIVSWRDTVFCCLPLSKYLNLSLLEPARRTSSTNLGYSQKKPLLQRMQLNVVLSWFQMKLN